MNGKINQLLTAIRSPIAAIEQDDRPPPSHRSRDVNLVALQVDSEQRRQPVTGYKMFDHFNSVGSRGPKLVWCALIQAIDHNFAVLVRS